MAVRKNIYLILAVGWALFILVSSLLALSSIPNIGFNWSDKVMHMLVYLILTLLAGLYLLESGKLSKLWKVSILIVAFGIIIEIFQYIMPYGRMFELGDILANTSGVLIAVGILKFLLPAFLKLKRKK